MHIVQILVCSFSLATIAAPGLAQDNPLAVTLESLGGHACVVGELTCVTLPVPWNHFANDPSLTIDITFAVSLASEPSKGLLFYVVGGPGGSGMAVADDYLSAFDESLAANMDIVFFDQRGIGPDHGLECPLAGAAFDSADLPLDPPDATLQIIQTFVTDCQVELKHPELLPFVGTDQAIRDLDLFRQKLGVPKVWIYGESYGTQFAQQYATAFPDTISGVILDGVVDLNLSFEAFYKTYIEGSEKILTRVLDACVNTPGCGSDMKGNASDVYKTLAAQLDQAPIEIDFPMGDGTSEKRLLTGGLLETNAFYSLYGPGDRATFLRALAAASRSDLLPMLREGYVNLAIDPATGDAIPDPTWFGAAYYAITCSDYDDAGDTTEAKVAQILADAKVFAPNAPRLLRTYYSERLACAYWPNHGPKTRPEPFAGGDYPTLVLNADTDPITPAEMAYSVFDHVQNGHIVIMQGGPHVIWGRGYACPDQIVSDLMFDGTEPLAPVQLCQQDFIGAYDPLTMLDPADAGQPFKIATALETEIDWSPALYGWQGEEPLAVGCDFGGSVRVSAEDAGTLYTFTACQWWKDVVLDGTGLLTENDEPADGMTFDLKVSGGHQGQFTYHNNTATEARKLAGTFDGVEVSTPRPLP